VEPELCLSKEHGGGSGDGNCDLSRITYEPFNEKFLPEFCGLFWQYWYVVNQEDLSTVRTVVCYGEEFPMTDVEAKYYVLRAERYSFQMAKQGGVYIGFMMYHLVYDCILIIDGLFVEPQCEKLGVCKGLVNSLKTVKKVFFQTRIANPPQRLHDKLNKDAVTEVCRSETKITWEMTWVYSTVLG